MTEPPLPNTGLRIKFSKHGKIRFTSHRDIARIWERTVRKVELPLAWTQGFSPRPKMSFGLALSTGSVSDAEYIDVILDTTRVPTSNVNPGVSPSSPLALLPCPVEELPGTLTAALPAGLVVLGVAELTAGASSLQQAVTSCSWEIELSETTMTEANDWAQAVLDAPSLIVTRERKGKPVTDDLRPSIRSLQVDPNPDPGSSVVLLAELATQPRALRPTELLEALDAGFVATLTRRRHQWIEWDGQRHDPLEVDTAHAVYAVDEAAPVPHAEACAQ
jgi:uncharacterized protein (DUF2344 family)